MMELSGDMPITLIIKAPNQHMADQTVDCMLGWTIKKLKRHLEIVYPSKPKHNEQRLIYSGKLLQDHLTLKEILHKNDSSFMNQHTVHLVCSVIMDTSSSTALASKTVSGHSLPDTSSSSIGSHKSDEASPDKTEEIRYRGHGQLSEPDSSPISTSAYNTYSTSHSGTVHSNMASYTTEQYAGMIQQQQQIYAHYIMQYMLYYQYLCYPGMPVNHLMSPSAITPVISNSPLQQQQLYAQQALAVNNGVQDVGQGDIEMNAQGGMEDEDDDGEPRDWLHYIYFFMRILTLTSILVFYSNLTRFLIVITGSFAIYLLQKLRQDMQRAQQQQEDNTQQQQQEELRNEEVQEDILTPETDSDSESDAEEEDNRITRMLVFLCNTVELFFSSLLPTPPEVLQN